jgi:hypothetical protein
LLFLLFFFLFLSFSLLSLFSFFPLLVFPLDAVACDLSQLVDELELPDSELVELLLLLVEVERDFCVNFMRTNKLQSGQGSMTCVSFDSGCGSGCGSNCGDCSPCSGCAALEIHGSTCGLYSKIVAK